MVFGTVVFLRGNQPKQGCYIRRPNRKRHQRVQLIDTIDSEASDGELELDSMISHVSYFSEHCFMLRHLSIRDSFQSRIIHRMKISNANKLFEVPAKKMT